MAAGSRPWRSISEVTVSAPTQVRRAGQMNAAVVSWITPAATSRPRAICATGPPATGAGSANVTGAPARAAATEPSGSALTTTIGVAPPDQARSAIRRTDGRPSASASADSGLAARITAATVTRRCYQRLPCDNPRPMDLATRSTLPDDLAPREGIARRDDVRNVAIVAHVDHGKTTLVDAMLRQTGTFRANEAVVDRVLDSGDLEREKGITILAKQTTVDHGGVRLNIVDTPGHADFDGEVERSLLMVDSVLLLVDAAEGPLPQTRYVLQKAMARHLPVVVALNKIDRSDARPTEVLDEVYELFIDLGADEHQIEFPIVYTNAKAGTATRSLDEPGVDLRPLLDLLITVTPAPTYTDGHPLQLLVTNLMANDYVGRMAVGRIWNGSIRLGQRVSVVREEADDTAGTIEPGRTVTLTGTVTSLQTAHGIDRVDIEDAGPGDIVSVAGLPEVT